MTRETAAVFVIVVLVLASAGALARIRRRAEIEAIRAEIEANRAAMQAQIDSLTPARCVHDDPVDLAAMREEIAALNSAASMRRGTR